MLRTSVGVFLVSLATLVLELMLTRVFDVLLVPNLAYFVVAAAIFAFGLAGIYAVLRPLPSDEDVSSLLVRRAIAFGVATLVLIPIINILPLDYTHLLHRPISTLAAWLVMYFALVAPFYLAGSVLITAFSKYAQQIQRLYFWDLAGAGAGSLVVIPLISRLGPGGLMVLASALALIAAALFSRHAVTVRSCVVMALVLALVPVIGGPQRVDFNLKLDKRGVKHSLEQGKDEFTRWDPISRIDVIDETWSPETATPWHKSGDRKAIQYDAGNQTSYFYKFDGDLQGLRDQLDSDKSRVKEQFWQLGVLASHWLKRDSGQQVLVIGSAGGQESKAALMYGAQHVDAVELVPTVVELATHQYSPYIGNVLLNPAVHVVAGEGRSFLRHSHRTYDIIQMYSNHTNSSIAQGMGALAPVYLQTAEAYREYFTHLSPNGVLHINHHVYPRMITTAALAWRQLGRKDFARHVAVFASKAEPMLPTLLIKMEPWTAQEIESLSAFLAPAELDPAERMELVENPIDPRQDFLPPSFYSGDLPDSVADAVPAQITARTDDKPYFGELRKTARVVQADKRVHLDEGTAYLLNLMLNKGVPMDWVHLVLTGFASLFFMVLFVFLPLKFSTVGKEKGTAALPLLLYFSCLGMGFIMIELVLIQKLMHLIGSPLYTYSVVIFAVLLSAGFGSAASERWGITARRGWFIPFIALIIIGLTSILLYPRLIYAALSLSQGWRIGVAALMIFPFGFFLGMPFPLGVLALAEHPRGAIAWAWGMNGLFTVIGSLLSVLLSMAWGFNLTLAIAIGLYIPAAMIFTRLRRAPIDATGSSAARAPEISAVLS